MIISTIYSNKQYKNNSIFFTLRPIIDYYFKEERGRNPQYLDGLNCQRRHKLATTYIKVNKNITYKLN